MSHRAGTIADMLAENFSPWGESRPCWHCHWFAGLANGGTSAVCDLLMCCRCRSMP